MGISTISTRYEPGRLSRGRSQIEWVGGVREGKACQNCPEKLYSEDTDTSAVNS